MAKKGVLMAKKSDGQKRRFWWPKEGVVMAKKGVLMAKKKYHPIYTVLFEILNLEMGHSLYHRA